MKRSLQFFLVSESLQLLLISLTANLQSYAQPDSAMGFFPLHTNDLRQYHYQFYDCCCNINNSTYYIERVLGDTILSTGFQYKIVESNQSQGPTRRYVRVDTTTANVYEYSGDISIGDYLVDSLRATVGSEFRGGNGVPIQCAGVDTATVLGTLTMVKRFSVGGTRYSLAYGLGLVEVNTMAFECGTWYWRFTDLSYARIDGQEYGPFVGVNNEYKAVPTAFTLVQNYPNPFNPSTTIRYALPARSHVTLSVFNTLGQQVATLVNETQNAGFHEVKFDGSGLASGVYFYRLQAGDFVQTKQLLLLR